MAHVARAPGKFGRRLCVLSPCRLQPACSTGVDRYRVGVGWWRPRCTSTLLSLPLLLYLSVYLSLSDYPLLSLRAAVSVSQNGEGARSCLCRQHRKGQLGRAGTFNGPTPPASSPSLGLTRLHPHRLRPFYLRFTSQLPLLCKTRGTR